MKYDIIKEPYLKSFTCPHCETLWAGLGPRSSRVTASPARTNASPASNPAGPAPSKHTRMAVVWVRNTSDGSDQLASNNIAIPNTG